MFRRTPAQHVCALIDPIMLLFPFDDLAQPSRMATAHFLYLLAMVGRILLRRDECADLHFVVDITLLVESSSLNHNSISARALWYTEV